MGSFVECPDNQTGDSQCHHLWQRCVRGGEAKGQVLCTSSSRVTSLSNYLLVLLGGEHNCVGAKSPNRFSCPSIVTGSGKSNSSKQSVIHSGSR